ncbi:MAG TPA: HEAT repeat domain-containing protein [Polyangiaceae bacterium]|nr:HEAT repeat domain-containing protein [Polyangiaceae bacterium]
MWGLPPLPRNLAAAIRDADHPKRDVRLSAVRDLVRHTRGDERAAAIEKLCHVLQHDSELDLRAEAAVALADADAREALEPLMEAARRGERRLRQMAVLAIGEVAPPDDEEAVAVLRSAFRASDEAVRFQALVALHHVSTSARRAAAANATVGSDAAEQAVFDAARDDDPELRAMAFRIAEERFAESPPPAHFVTVTEKALKDDDAAVRLCAAILLGSWGNAAGGHELIDVVANAPRVGTEADHQAAIELAAKLELPDAVPALERRAYGPFGLRRDSVSWHAQVALARLGHQRATRAILRGLRAWSRDARTLSVVAAGRAHLAEARPLLTAMRGNESSADQHAVEQALAELG